MPLKLKLPSAAVAVLTVVAIPAVPEPERMMLIPAQLPVESPASLKTPASPPRNRGSVVDAAVPHPPVATETLALGVPSKPAGATKLPQEVPAPGGGKLEGPPGVAGVLCCGVGMPRETVPFMATAG